MAIHSHIKNYYVKCWNINHVELEVAFNLLSASKTVAPHSKLQLIFKCG